MFLSNVPVSAARFHNRTQELQRLEQILDRLKAGTPTWLAILGLRKIGKTSLLLELSRRCVDMSLVFVLIDVSELGPPTVEIFRRFAYRLLDGFLADEIGLSLEAAARSPSTFRGILQHCADFNTLSPEFRSQILELPERPLDASFVAEVLAFPELLARALDRNVIVSWDEFQALGTLATGRRGVDVFSIMRAAWQKHERVAYVVSGSERRMLTEMLTDEHSPFFQHFSLMELGPFSTKDGVGLLVNGAPRDRPIPRSLAKRAVAAIGTHPFYLQMLGEELTSALSPYHESDLKHTLQSLLFSRTGRLALYLENTFNALVGRSTYLSAVLQALADGPKRLTQIARAIDAPTGSTVRYLERLGDAVISAKDGGYALADPTFALWLRWRQPGGTVIPMALIGDESEQLVAQELSRMGFELVYQSRASRGAFDLLGIRGPYQVGIQVKRSSLPLRFKLGPWQRMQSDAKRFGWLWTVAAVDPAKNRLLLLDPQKARVGKEVRLHESAAIDNLLSWVERR